MFLVFLVRVGCKVSPKQPAFVEASAVLKHLAEGRQGKYRCVSEHCISTDLM